MGRFIIDSDDPAASDIQALLDVHLAFMHDQSPPEDVYALDSVGLGADDISFFSVRDEGRLLGVGALRQLDAAHAEIKSMHTVPSARGRGVGRAMLDHLLQIARSRGCTRISLETGTVPAFEPARVMYESVGFAPCPPFADYRPSPYSMCMTMELTIQGGGDADVR